MAAYPSQQCENQNRQRTQVVKTEESIGKGQSRGRIDSWRDFLSFSYVDSVYWIHRDRPPMYQQSIIHPRPFAALSSCLPSSSFLARMEGSSLVRGVRLVHTASISTQSPLCVAFLVSALMPWPTSCTAPEIHQPAAQPVDCDPCLLSSPPKNEESCPARQHCPSQHAEA